MQRSNNLLKARIDQVGWIVAAAIAGVILSSGFQNGTDKIGVVDLVGVVTKSNKGIGDSQLFEQLKKNRQDLLDFVGANPIVSLEQAQQLHDLVTKESPSDADKAQVTKIEGDIKAASDEYQALAQKTNVTDPEKTKIAEYRHRMDVMLSDGGTYARWGNEFTAELQDWSEKKHNEGLNKARDAVAQVAKAQGFTMVFDKQVAPYGANDLTDAALQAMNAQK
jgi:Skp family chaperone for outer membrane proteins